MLAAPLALQQPVQASLLPVPSRTHQAGCQGQTLSAVGPPGSPPWPSGQGADEAGQLLPSPGSDHGGGTGSGSSLDIGRMLVGLRRGSVPGAETNLAFLCHKFSMLADRLHRAEASETEAERKSERLQAELQFEEAEVRADHATLEAEAANSHEEACILAAAFSQAEQEERDAEERCANAQQEEEALAQRRSALDERCASERVRLAEVNGRLLHLQSSQPGGREELRRMQGHLETLTARYTAAVAELRSFKERASREEVHMAKARSEASREEEERGIAGQLAARRRDELDEALGTLASLRERLAEVQVSIHKCETEQRRRSECGEQLVFDLQRREAWLTDAAREAEGLQDAGRGLGRVLANIEELRTRTEAEEEAAMALEGSTAAHEASVAELQQREADLRAGPMEDAARERVMLKSEVAEAEAQRAQLEQAVERLRHEQVAGGGARRNLEGELRLLLVECEKLRKEHSVFLVERGETHQRLQLVTPALAEAKRRLKELEANLEAAQARAAGERQHGERLERETAACQDKMRAVRDENVRLAERCAQLEAQIPRGRAGGGGSTAAARRIAAAAAAASAAHHASAPSSAAGTTAAVAAPARGRWVPAGGKPGSGGASRAASGPPGASTASAAARPGSSRGGGSGRGGSLGSTAPQPRTPRLGSGRAAGGGRRLSSTTSAAAASTAAAVGAGGAPSAAAFCDRGGGCRSPGGGSGGDGCSNVLAQRPLAGATSSVPPLPTCGDGDCSGGGGGGGIVGGGAATAASAIASAHDLQYLVNWVRNEEERLPGGARGSPPRPHLCAGTT